VPRLRNRPDGDYGSTAALEHPAYRLLRWKPNEWQTAFQFRLALAGHAINRGNGYAYVYRDGPRPVEMVLLDPDATEPAMVGGRLWYVTTIAGDERKLPAADVFHLRGFGFDGLRGYPLWQMAREAIALGLSADQFRGAGTRTRPGRPWCSPPNKINEQAVTRLRNDWERMHTGLDNAHRTADSRQRAEGVHAFVQPGRDAGGGIGRAAAPRRGELPGHPVQQTR
jgi:HK97 family phage portal protein